MFGFWLRKLFRQFRTVHVRMNANCQVINCGTTRVRRADENRKEDTTKRHSIWTKRMTIWWGTHNTVSALTFDQPNGIHSTSITTNAWRYFRSSELFGCCVVVVIGCVTTSHIHVYQTVGVSDLVFRSILRCIDCISHSLSNALDSAVELVCVRIFESIGYVAILSFPSTYTWHISLFPFYLVLICRAFGQFKSFEFHCPFHMRVCIVIRFSFTLFIFGFGFRLFHFVFYLNMLFKIQIPA